MGLSIFVTTNSSAVRVISSGSNRLMECAACSHSASIASQRRPNDCAAAPVVLLPANGSEHRVSLVREKLDKELDERDWHPGWMHPSPLVHGEPEISITGKRVGCL